MVDEQAPPVMPTFGNQDRSEPQIDTKVDRRPKPEEEAILFD